MFHMKQFAGRMALCLTILPMTGAFARDRTCTVVTNGRPEIFLHELAHCNGWKHAPFDPTLLPPEEFMFVYDGKLVVIMSRRDDMQTRMDAAISADRLKISVSEQSVAALCAKLWGGEGIPAATYKPYLKDIAGCSVQ